MNELEAARNLQCARTFLQKLRRQVENPLHKSTIRSVIFMLHPKINPRISFLKDIEGNER